MVEEQSLGNCKFVVEMEKGCKVDNCSIVVVVVVAVVIVVVVRTNKVDDQQMGIHKEPSIWLLSLKALYHTLFWLA